MKVYDLIIKRRTIRKFKQKNVDFSILKKCVNAARFSASGSNLQPLKYIIITNRDLLQEVYSCLSWAGYIENFNNSEQKPKAYVIILVNKNIRENADKDVGIAAENICLTAFEDGIASCMVGSINKERLRTILSIPDYFEISLIIALGYADEESKAVETEKNIKYYYKADKLHVPKRKLKDILHINKF